MDFAKSPFCCCEKQKRCKEFSRIPLTLFFSHFDLHFLHAPHFAVDVELGFHETCALAQFDIIQLHAFGNFVELLLNGFTLPDEFQCRRLTTMLTWEKNLLSNQCPDFAYTEAC